MFLIFFHFSCFQRTGIARVRSRSDKIVRLSRRNDLLENTQRTRWIAKLVAIQKLPSGNCGAMVRRKGIFKSDRLRRRKDVEQLALETESRIDHGECGSTKCVDKTSTFGNLIDIHIVDTHEVSKSLTRRFRFLHSQFEIILHQHRHHTCRHEGTFDSTPTDQRIPRQTAKDLGLRPILQRTYQAFQVLTFK